MSVRAFETPQCLRVGAPVETADNHHIDQIRRVPISPFPNMSTTEEESSPYELLGLALEATEAEIKTAYRQRSLKVHPDRVRESTCL